MSLMKIIDDAIKIVVPIFMILNFKSSGCMTLVSIMATVTQMFLYTSFLAQESNRAKQIVFPMATIAILDFLSLFASVWQTQLL